MPLKDVFQQQLRRFRKNSHLSQRKLSELVGKKVTYIHHLEAGNRYPTMEMLPVIAQALRVPVLALLSSDTYALSPEIADILSRRPDLQELILAANDLDDKNLRQLIGITKTMNPTELPK